MHVWIKAETSYDMENALSTTWFVHTQYEKICFGKTIYPQS